MKVFVAMSGGVDSSVAAAILKESGYQVVGGTMDIIPPAEAVNNTTARDAARIADKLSIPHHTFDLKQEFAEGVIEYFVGEYSQARTPNPCVICNPRIKFGKLREEAFNLGCDYFATGHYARIKRNKSGRYLLKKSVDRKKDQTYMLYRLAQNQLQRTLFPLGEYTKKEIRDRASKLELNIPEGEESQEICFIKDKDYTRFLEQHYTHFAAEGPIYDTDGNKLGQHRGLHHYTIGQRRGLGISLPYPVYVIKMDKENNALIVGKDESVFSRGFTAESLNWIAEIGNDEFSFPLQCRVKIRYNSPEVEAIIYKQDELIKTEFENKQRAVTPGQSAVFYLGDTVIGGGIIREKI